jgi:hypothetical protein
MTRSRKHKVDIPQARAELEWLRSRYDGGAISTAVFTVLKRLECDIAWAEHERRRMQS